MRIGIDLGGTKISGIALDDSGAELARLREATPNEYKDILEKIFAVVVKLESAAAEKAAGIPLPPGGEGRDTGKQKCWPTLFESESLPHPLPGGGGL